MLGEAELGAGLQGFGTRWVSVGSGWPGDDLGSQVRGAFASSLSGGLLCRSNETGLVGINAVTCAVCSEG